MAGGDEGPGGGFRKGRLARKDAGVPAAAGGDFGEEDVEVLPGARGDRGIRGDAAARLLDLQQGAEGFVDGGDQECGAEWQPFGLQLRAQGAV